MPVPAPLSLERALSLHLPPAAAPTATHQSFADRDPFPIIFPVPTPRARWASADVSFRSNLSNNLSCKLMWCNHFEPPTPALLEALAASLQAATRTFATCRENAFRHMTDNFALAAATAPRQLFAEGDLRIAFASEANKRVEEEFIQAQKRQQEEKQAADRAAFTLAAQRLATAGGSFCGVLRKYALEGKNEVAATVIASAAQALTSLPSLCM
jgi:hypothetical protein